MHIGTCTTKQRKNTRQ